jgi:6-phosphogluconolactonase
MPNIIVFPDTESLIKGAADFIAESGRRACAARGRFTLALCGGNTPKPVYARLATSGYQDCLDWSKVQIFFGDERCVPPEDPQSNYLMARTALLDKVPLPVENIHRLRGEAEPEEAAAAYAYDLERTFGGDAKAGTPPPEGFDLILLGVGDDGHTASLFPESAAVTEKKRWVMAHYVEIVGRWRLTLTPVVINAARQVAFLVSGAGKAEAVQRVLAGPYQPLVLPAQVIRPHSGELHWLLDAPAAARLRQEI